MHGPLSALPWQGALQAEDLPGQGPQQPSSPPLPVDPEATSCHTDSTWLSRREGGRWGPWAFPGFIPEAWSCPLTCHSSPFPTCPSPCRGSSPWTSQGSPQSPHCSGVPDTGSGSGSGPSCPSIFRELDQESQRVPGTATPVVPCVPHWAVQVGGPPVPFCAQALLKDHSLNT